MSKFPRSFEAYANARPSGEKTGASSRLSLWIRMRVALGGRGSRGRLERSATPSPTRARATASASPIVAFRSGVARAGGGGSTRGGAGSVFDVDEKTRVVEGCPLDFLRYRLRSTAISRID